jgi:hypothetical protein
MCDTVKRKLKIPHFPAVDGHAHCDSRSLASFILKRVLNLMDARNATRVCSRARSSPVGGTWPGSELFCVTPSSDDISLTYLSVGMVRR